MYKRGHDYDYQYDWVLKKAGHKIPEHDYADAKPMVGNIAAQQGKDLQNNDAPQNKLGGNTKDFIMERKENRAMLGQQVINNGLGGSNQNQAMAKARHASAKKRNPAPITPGLQQ